MAKATGPLFSLAASGSLNNLTFQPYASQSSATNPNPLHSATIRYKPTLATQTPSDDQLIQRARVRAAAAAWVALSTVDKAKWKAKGINVYEVGMTGTILNTKNGYALFVREWMTQGVESPLLPLLPA